MTDTVIVAGAEGVSDTPHAPAPLAAPPSLLAILKDDLGIAAGDTTNDAWLQRRIDGVWARMEKYTSRRLCAPPAAFIDDWGLIVVNAPSQPVPPALMFPPGASVFLRYFPVAAISAITMDGAAGNQAGVRFDPNTGKLLGLTPGALYAEDLSCRLIGSRARITYTAGWAAVPGDLYELVLGTIQPMWQQHSTQTAGLPINGRITSIDVMDVGSIGVESGSQFVAAASKNASGSADPLLGPYTALLDHYVDHRVRIGHALMPVTVPGP